MSTIVFIEGMTCDHCVARVTNAISKVTGVSRVNVDLKLNRATVQAEAVTDEALRVAVEDAGYVVKAIQTA